MSVNPVSACSPIVPPVDSDRLMSAPSVTEVSRLVTPNTDEVDRRATRSAPIFQSSIPDASRIRASAIAMSIFADRRSGVCMIAVDSSDGRFAAVGGPAHAASSGVGSFVTGAVAGAAPPPAPVPCSTMRSANPPPSADAWRASGSRSREANAAANTTEVPRARGLG